MLSFDAKETKNCEPYSGVKPKHTVISSFLNKQDLSSSHQKHH